MNWNEDWQVMTMKRVNVPGKQFFMDLILGKEYNCPQYLKMVRGWSALYLQHRFVGVLS